MDDNFNRTRSHSDSEQHTEQPISSVYSDQNSSGKNINTYSWAAHNGANDDSVIGSQRDSRSTNARKTQSPKFRASYDDLLVGDARMNRIAQAEAAIRQDMFKECTFRPEILSLPPSYGTMKGIDTPFHDRVTKWQKEKENEIKNKSKAVQNSEVIECTFHPKINRNSDRAIKELRGNNEESANDRLYKSANLYNEQRFKLIEDEKIKEDDIERIECTFQPQLITKKNRLYSQVNSKFDQPATPARVGPYAHNQQPPLSSSISKDCTFIPKINKIKSNMSSAKLYVSTNVVDRLTRPLSGGGDNGSDESPETAPMVMDMASFMGNLSSFSNQQQAGTAFQTPNHHRPSTAPGSRSGIPVPIRGGLQQQAPAPADGEPDSKEKQLRFEQFLERQKQVTKRKEDNIKQISRSITPNFKPKLHTASSAKRDEAATVRVQGVTVFDRMERQVQKRQSEEQNREVVVDENCTFAPRINKNAEKLRPRTSFEMSRGDLLKKDTNRRMLKLQTEQQELSNMTFQPQISHYAKENGTKSVLQLSSDPSQFLDWYQNKNQEREAGRQQELKRREDAEVANCTFSPKTIDCPAYVRRIAKSMAVVKAARSSNGGSYADEQAAKTQWR